MKYSIISNQKRVFYFEISIFIYHFVLQYSEDIETNEAMLFIPKHLMLSPPIAFNDHDIGHELKSSSDILRGDLLMTVYISHEMMKSTKSFYYPYLSILPEVFPLSFKKNNI